MFCKIGNDLFNVMIVGPIKVVNYSKEINQDIAY